MIPTLLLGGFVAGALVRDLRSFQRTVVIGVIVSVFWGIVVGVSAASAGVVVGGTALGLANLVVGALVGWSLRAMLDAARRRLEPPPPRGRTT